MKTAEEKIAKLYRKVFGKNPDSITPLPGSGSYRVYYRITAGVSTSIGVYNADTKENKAFLSFTRTFLENGLPVPGIPGKDLNNHCYLLTDLGNLTLFQYLTGLRKNSSSFPEEITRIYRKSLETLLKFQITAGRQIDFRKCTPRHAFDTQSMHWDLNYFKYYFLKLARIPFDEQALEDDYDALTSFLMQAPSRYFMYRDFQSRNILLPDQEPFFIDYQGGRRGALQYDVASLLYDSKADLPEEIRSELVDFYLENLESYVPGKQEEFLRFYPAFILIRILQALGAYGFRGYYEQKSHFLQSVPYALENLRTLTTKMEIGVPLPELFHVLDHLIRQPSPGSRLPVSGIGYPASDLTVSIASFAYKDGIPRDPGGHGGGFVFDCRALPNPGRFEQYQQLTGKDKPVIDFLVDQREVDEFLNYVNELVGQAVRSYLQREFTHLSVAFGCTGGQHRSVYCAEKLASYLAKTFPIKVSVNHLSIVTS